MSAEDKISVPDGHARWRVSDVYRNEIGELLIALTEEAYVTKGEAWPKVGDVLKVDKE